MFLDPAYVRDRLDEIKNYFAGRHRSFSFRGDLAAPRVASPAAISPVPPANASTRLSSPPVGTKSPVDTSVSPAPARTPDSDPDPSPAPVVASPEPIQAEAEQERNVPEEDSSDPLSFEPKVQPIKPLAAEQVDEIELAPEESTES
jgi:hypothetical protein